MGKLTSGLALLLLLTSGPAARAQDKHHRQPVHGGAQHGMHRSFNNAERWAKHFDGKERDAWQRPAAVIAALKLAPEMIVADIGAGTGYFAVRFARAVPRGHVYGVDIEPDMVRYLAQRARREKLTNLTSLRGEPADPRLPRAVDMIFVCDTYHHISARTDYFARLRSKLRPGGRLVIVDFKSGKLPVGPPEKHRVSPRQLDGELAPAGYVRRALDLRTLPHQYIATYAARAAR